MEKRVRKRNKRKEKRKRKRRKDEKKEKTKLSQITVKSQLLNSLSIIPVLHITIKRGIRGGVIGPLNLIFLEEGRQIFLILFSVILDVLFGGLFARDGGISIGTEDREELVFTLDKVVELMDGCGGEVRIGEKEREGKKRKEKERKTNKSEGRT